MTAKLLRPLAALAGAGAVALSAAPAAHANSFSEGVLGATYSYNDGQDQLCVDTRGTSVSAQVSLRPSAYGQAGPTYDFRVAAGQRVCRSLATAYEDTYYFVSLDARRGVAGTFVTKRFYS